MLGHLFNLLGRAVHAIPTSLGSTWLGLLFPLWGFLVTELVILVRDGWRAMKTSVKENLFRGFAVAGIAWCSLFAWCVVTTTYSDHSELNAHIRVLHQSVVEASGHEEKSVNAVKDDLGGKLHQLQESCAEIKGANGALEKQNKDQQGTINNCQDQAIKLLAPEALKIVPLVLERPGNQIGLNKIKWLVLTNRTFDPVKVVVSCNKRITSANVAILGSQAMIGGTDKLDNTSYEINVSSPAWGAESPLVFEMEYVGSEFVTCSFNPR